MFRDPDFGLVNLRVFGSYRWRVGAPDNFINQFVGTFGAIATPDFENRLREQMVLLVYNSLGKLKDQGMKVTDLAGQLSTIEQAVLGFAPQHFSPLGVEIMQIQGLSINLPPDVQAAVNERSKMGVLEGAAGAGAPIGLPHPGQKRLPAGTIAPHLAHCRPGPPCWEYIPCIWPLIP